MNERQPYEQHLAEKMQQLPPPLEPDKAWEKMKVLLDNELPRGNGTGGNGRWWIIGMIAGILLIGTWMFNQHRNAGETTAAKKPTAVDTSPNASQQQENIAKLPPVQHPPGANRNNAPSTAQTDQSQDPRISQVNPDQQQAAQEIPPRSNKNSRANADAARTDQAIIAAKEQRTTDDKSQSDEDIGKTIQPLHPIPQNNKLPAYTSNSTQHSDKEKKSKSGKSSSNVYVQPKNASPAIPPSTSKLELSGSMPAEIIPTSSSIETNQLLAGQKMNTEHSLNRQQLAVKYTAKKINRRSDRTDRAFAFGFSLPLAFPLADQQALGYNFRGGSNTVSDYIPSPHLQYHVNRKTYFQTEIQVVTPQYIRPILMYQQKAMINANTWMYNSVYARKLYYFNLPVSVYHSPMPNFFLGTGLQFSSLMSGVAMYENKKVYGNQETILTQQFNRINHDSLTNRMNSSEIRLLLDVNYYWQRFTVGLRYNQAFGNYANFRLNNTTGYTYDKNKALFFYLRYNIWEDKKRNAPARSMLTLK
jgi:hypothetical protein